MANKVTDFSALAAGTVAQDTDVLYVVDVSAGVNGSSKITVTDLLTARTFTTSATVSGAAAGALSVGPNGATNPALQVDASVSSAATGVKITGRAAAAGASVAVISSGNNDGLTVDAKGSGTLILGGTSTGLISLGRGSTKGTLGSSTKTSLATQNTTPTAAQLLGGYVQHASTTGAGTATLDTAANIDTAIAGVTTGDYFQCVYANTGTQTVTITTASGLTLKGTAAVPSGKNAILDFFRTGSGAWDVVITLSA